MIDLTDTVKYDEEYGWYAHALSGHCDKYINELRGGALYKYPKEKEVKRKNENDIHSPFGCLTCCYSHGRKRKC